MLKYFIEKLKSIKTEYMERSPQGKWQFVLNLAVFFQKLIGVEILDTNFKVWWFTYVGCLGLIDVVSSFSYTLWYYANTPFKGFLFLSLIGVFIPVDFSVFCYFIFPI